MNFIPRKTLTIYTKIGVTATDLKYDYLFNSLGAEKNSGYYLLKSSAYKSKRSCLLLISVLIGIFGESPLPLQYSV
jgi:hypothetical protein